MLWQLNAKRVPALLMTIGPTTYAPFSNLFAPDAPKDKSLEEIFAVLSRHFEPTQSVIAEHFHFYRRDQMATETIGWIPRHTMTTSLQLWSILGGSTTRQAHMWSTHWGYPEQTTVTVRSWPYSGKRCKNEWPNSLHQLASRIGGRKPSSSICGEIPSICRGGWMQCLWQERTHRSRLQV